MLLDSSVYIRMWFIAEHGNECQIFANTTIDTNQNGAWWAA